MKHKSPDLSTSGPQTASSPPIFPCQIPELNLSCYGCCGNDFTNKIQAQKDIIQNTIELEESLSYKESNSQEDQDKALVEFRDRYAGTTLGPSGVCLNLVQFNDGCLACPLHKSINALVPESEVKAPSEDLRQEPCDVNYECITFKKYVKLSNSQKEDYIKFLEKRVEKENHFSYSMKNHDGVFIEEFLRKNK